MAGDWLKTGDYLTDLNSDYTVNFEDFAVFAPYWLEDHRWPP